MKYPALDVRCDNPDLLLTVVDDFSATAIEDRGDVIRVFFSSAESRDAAGSELANRFRFEVDAVDVPDEDWARRSQEHLQPVTVGRIVVVTPSTIDRLPSAGGHQSTTVVLCITPSMGFGTGHHATTRLCLEALQTIDLRGASVLDAGTGSGILAIAAERLGAARAIGIDDDPDAVQAARENLDLNPSAAVTFVVGDLRTVDLREADVVTANLTGALLVRAASILMMASKPGGRLVLSGILSQERDDVVAAFGRGDVVWERHEDEWVGLVMRLNPKRADAV